MDKEMNNEKDRNQKLLAIIGIVLFLFLLFGGTYAYFSVGVSSDFGTRTIVSTADEIGAVTLNGSSAALTMDLTLLDMMIGENNITYYASSEGKTTTATEEVLGTASVSPTTDTNYYHCEYTLNITQTNTGDKNMYNIFKGTQQVDGNTYTSSANEFVLTVNGVDYDLHSNTLPKQIEGEFYIKGEQTQNITAGLRLVNIANKNQKLLTGSNVQINISVVNDSFKCTSEEEPIPASTTLIALTEDTNNASKISKYTGPVTDECSASSCTTVQQAQNVYIVKSDDINNVIFEDYCWKIIRTTETGGTKLLYNGTPITVDDHQECVANNGENAMLTAVQMGTESNKITYIQGGTYNKPAYVGYMYNKTSGTLREMLYADDVNTNDSLLKEKIEYWFQNNSNIDESKLEDAVYCNDRSLVSYSPATTEELDDTYNQSTIGDVYFKNYSQQSTLECTNVTDSFNTVNAKAKTNYKVGFMTEAERYLIGSTTAANGQYYWLGSPYRFSGFAFVRRVQTDGSGKFNSVNGANGVRPVVSTSSSVQITSGEGSTTKPFIFE